MLSQVSHVAFRETNEKTGSSTSSSQELVDKEDIGGNNDEGTEGTLIDPRLETPPYVNAKERKPEDIQTHLLHTFARLLPVGLKVPELMRRILREDPVINEELSSIPFNVFHVLRVLCGRENAKFRINYHGPNTFVDIA